MIGVKLAAASPSSNCTSQFLEGREASGQQSAPIALAGAGAPREAVCWWCKVVWIIEKRGGRRGGCGWNY